MKEESVNKDSETALQVRETLAAVKKSAPDGVVELRIPPFGAIRCVAGAKHRRENPANQVEMRAKILIQLFENPSLWHQLVKSGQIQASGELSDLSQVFSTAFQKTPHNRG